MRISVHSETLTTPIWMRGREWRIQSTRSCVWRWQRDISVCLGSGKWWASRRWRWGATRGATRGWVSASWQAESYWLTDLHDTALCTEWCRVRARAFCWEEELLLVRGEFAKGSGDTGLSSQLVGKSTRMTHRVVSWNNGRSFGIHLQAGISSTSSSIIVLLAPTHPNHREVLTILFGSFTDNYKKCKLAP